MATPVTMPQLGETVVEGTITRWLKNEGDTIERDEPLFEISTDKVDTEVPSPLAGTLVEIKVQEGETVGVGTELALIETDGAGSASSSAPAAEAGQQPSAPAGAGDGQPATASGSGAVTVIRDTAESTESVESVEPAEPVAPAEPAEPAEPATVGSLTAGAQALTGRGPRSHILSPLVRRLAEENHIDLAQVEGTGTGGRISKKDVMAYLATRGAAPDGAPTAAPAAAASPPAGAAPPPPAAPAAAAATPAPAHEAPAGTAGTAGSEEVIPLSRMRQAIATNMVASIQTSARAWNLVEVNMEHVVRVREAAKDDFKARDGINLTYMPFVARAVCEALLAFPDVNAEIRGDQLIRKHFVNLGIAVALDDGLIVPVVKGADTMNVVGLARAINDVATRARTKRLVPDDVHGGTFTITNPGPFGSIMSVPIINQPQCAILAFDAIEKRPVVIDDAIAIRHMVYLSMSWDHRIIDGATAAKFLARLKQNLEAWDFGPEVGLPARATSAG